MKQLFLYLILFSIPIVLNAQAVNWDESLTWEQVIKKAKTEAKHIFVDCYATWCRPCKVMDNEVFSTDTVANFINANFISIKVQLDSTKHDNEEIKKWYSKARLFEHQYSVRAFPTFLFFSAEGRLLHREVGGKTTEQFLTIANEALNPEKQYHTLLESYRHNRLLFKQVYDLAIHAKKLGEKEMAIQIANRYIREFIDKLSNDSFLTKPVLSFLAEFPDSLRPTHRFVVLAVKQSEKIDQIMNPGFSKNVANFFIRKELVIPVLAKAQKSRIDPDWKKLSKEIQKQFNENLAMSTLLEVKPDYYKFRKKWEQYLKTLIEQVESKSLQSFNNSVLSLDLNNYAWEIFLYSRDKEQLKKALIWIDRALHMADKVTLAGTMDTKANILYKMSRKKEAIEMQKKVVSMMPNDPVFQATLSKMQNDLPTWK